MAVLHRKEEKIQAVLGRLPKKYNSDDFVAMFIKLYSKDWGKIKSAYIKASQDKEPGTVIHMPKPELYLKQILEIFLSQRTETTPELPKEEVIATEKVVTVKKAKAISAEKSTAKVTKNKVAVKKDEEIASTPVIKKPKAASKKKTD